MCGQVVEQPGEEGQLGAAQQSADALGPPSAGADG